MQTGPIPCFLSPVSYFFCFFFCWVSSKTAFPESFLKPQFTLRDLLTKRECHKEVGGLSRLRRASRFSRTEFFVSPQDTMTEQALEALSASLGTRKPEPELDPSSIKEVDEVLTWGLTYKAC